MCVKFLIWMELCIYPISYMFWTLKGVVYKSFPPSYFRNLWDQLHSLSAIFHNTFVTEELTNSEESPSSTDSSDSSPQGLTRRGMCHEENGTHQSPNLGLCNSWFQRCWPHVSITRSTEEAQGACAVGCWKDTWNFTSHLKNSKEATCKGSI